MQAQNLLAVTWPSLPFLCPKFLLITSLCIPTVILSDLQVHLRSL